MELHIVLPSAFRFIDGKYDFGTLDGLPNAAFARRDGRVNDLISIAPSVTVYTVDAGDGYDFADGVRIPRAAYHGLDLDTAEHERFIHPTGAPLPTEKPACWSDEEWAKARLVSIDDFDSLDAVLIGSEEGVTNFAIATTELAGSRYVVPELLGRRARGAAEARRDKAVTDITYQQAIQLLR